MNIRNLAFALMLVASTADGQDAPKAKGELERPQHLVELILAAQVATPELAVDTLVSLVEKGKIRESKWRREIIEESYRLSSEVKNPVRLRVIPIKGVPVDTHAGYLSYAYDLKLDRLSLRSRIIKQMLLLDSERARQIVFEIGGKLSLKPMECSDTLVPEVSDIYSVVADVAKKSFSDQEVAEGVRGLFVAPWFENIESPMQIGPALDLLSKMQGSPAERHLLFSAFSRAIRKNFKDDRSFTFAVERDRLAAKVGVLVSGPDDPAKMDVNSAFRDFLVRNFRAPRCRDNEIKDVGQIPATVRDANFLFTDKPLGPDDIAHTDLKDGPKVVYYWRSHNARQLMNQLRVIRAEKEKLKDSENRSAAEWEAKVLAFLENLDSWKASDDEIEAAVFNQKSVLFISLASTVPEGKLKQSVLRSYFRYLSNSQMQKESYIEWLNYVRRAASSFPEQFKQAATELHNHSFVVLVAARKILSPDSAQPLPHNISPGKLRQY